MLPKRMIYVHPNNRLSNANIKEHRAAYLVIGSFAASEICRIVRMALFEL